MRLFQRRLRSSMFGTILFKIEETIIKTREKDIKLILNISTCMQIPLEFRYEILSSIINS